MTVNRQGQEEFARLMQETYTASTPLPDICNIQRYRREHKNREFVQIGKRTPVPTKVFNQGIMRPVAEPFARSVTKGEERFILTDLLNLAEDGGINSLEIDELSFQNIVEAASEVNDADTIFIPYTDQYTEVVNNWLTEGRLSRRKLDLDGREITIRRPPSNFGIRDIFVINSQNLKIVQKKEQESDPPKDFDSDSSLTHVNRDQELMVYFGSETHSNVEDSNWDEYIDVIYRVVISQPIVSSHAAFRLVAPPNVELANDA